MSFPNSNIFISKEYNDDQGARHIVISLPGAKSFDLNISDNDDLVVTRSHLELNYADDLDINTITEIERELVDYIKSKGSESQKKALKTYPGFSKSSILDILNQKISFNDLF